MYKKYGRTFVYLRVTGHAKRRQFNNKTKRLINRQANASVKSKELYPNAQADTFAFAPNIKNQSF